MIIDLEEPYRSRWKKGYLHQQPSGRRYVNLVNNHVDRTVVSYARYLMSVKIGYFVPDGYEVDHKDDDFTNDDINNLQILTSAQHHAKEVSRQRRDGVIGKLDELGLPDEVIGLECATCQTRFLIDIREYKKRLSTSRTDLAFCSRECSRIYFPPNGGELNNEQKEQIKILRQQGLSVYKIADITGFARNTIMKYW